MHVARATRRRCGWAYGVEEPEGIAAHYVEGAGANVSEDARVLHSHSEWIVGRSRAFVNSTGYKPLMTPQAMRPPAPPMGCVMWSSGLSWMMTEEPSSSSKVGWSLPPATSMRVW